MAVPTDDNIIEFIKERVELKFAANLKYRKYLCAEILEVLCTGNLMLAEKF